MTLADDDISNSRILIVEDDEAMRAMLLWKFETAGYMNSQATAHGLDALARVTMGESEDSPFDLILLDILLPDIDGVEVLKRIKGKHDIAVVALTAVEETSKILETLQEGADDYIVKPADIDVVLLKCEKVLAKHRLAKALRKATHSNQKLFLNVLQVMAKMLEAKDSYTRHHSENVAKYSRIIAKRIGLSRRRIDLINVAAMLHDFGKIGVMEGILNKPGKLSEEEMDSVKRHPLVAATILEPIAELSNVVDDVKYHHENYDGTGYPSGIKGNEIPLGARILRIADSYDAMTSNRSYREAMSRKAAIEELRRCSGTWFDPRVVQVFVEHLQEEEESENP